MLQNINIKDEEKQLYQAYENCLKRVEGDEFCTAFAKEKIKHSMQVVGAGNYILKNEKIFQCRSLEYLRLGKLVNLFHDIGRFREIEKLHVNPNSRHNHGYYSYDMLKELGYGDVRLLLPVKQHGGLPGALEEDKEYEAINKGRLKTEVEELYHLVKDADKIANLYLIKNDQHIFHNLFVRTEEQGRAFGRVSEVNLKAIEKHQLIKTADCVSICDRILQILCFVFELYYKPSVHFILHHNLLQNLMDNMRVYNPDTKVQDYVDDTIKQYISNKYNSMA